MIRLLYIVLALILVQCSPNKMQLEQGKWRAVLQLQDSISLPFLVTVKSNSEFEIHNREEKLILDEIHFKGDSIIASVPYFEGVFKGVYTSTKITGQYVTPSLNRSVPFYMEYSSKPRFTNTKEAAVSVDGVWETVFSKGTPESYIAKGIFEQKGNTVVGTFRTTTGDYRYLEGMVNGNRLTLATYDGSHAFVFKATIVEDTMKGVFYSGNHWVEPFEAKLNNSYELPDPNTLTEMKDANEPFVFSFPNTKGEIISNSLPQYKDRVVVVQLMGTWCPNCLDETKFLSKYKKQNQTKEFEIVALAFEYASSKERAIKAIKRIEKAINVPYPILLAQYGDADKAKAHEKLPGLNHVLSYPTTLFIDKNGKVRKIHTGFNGPATGVPYLQFKEEFNEIIDELLSE